MYLEHLNLVVSDLDATLKFYGAAFPHWYIRGQGHQLWHGTPRNWVHFGDETHYLTFNDSGRGENRSLTSNQLGLAHFAFVTDNIEALSQRLLQAGFPIHNQGAATQYRKNVYFLDPDGFELEFVQYLSDIPAERNQYL
ncbi:MULTISPECIES: VOC family protein [unclassified Agarivorans]|uniref:VOC family protein n=1 Tax=unclassified Agarivorans TaxID=2636026 RepID=UPI003D7ED325